MGKTAAKVSIGIWSLVFVLFATLFGYLWYNGGWGGLFLPLRGWYHNSSYQTVHEQTFTDPVQSLDLRWNGGDVSIRSSSSSEIKIVQKGVKNTPEEQFFQASVRDGVLTVTDGSTTAGLAFGPFPFSIGSDLEVYLPEETYDALSLETTDGDLFFEALQAERLEVRTQSGDAELSGVYQELAFASHNGDFLCRDVTVEQLACQTTSGDMEISGKLSQITATSTSGDVSLRTSQMITEATIQSTSGDVLLFLPENDGFTAQLHSSSGDLICAFPGFQGGNEFRYKDGGASIRLDTTSGDACLLYA